MCGWLFLVFSRRGSRSMSNIAIGSRNSEGSSARRNCRNAMDSHPKFAPVKGKPKRRAPYGGSTKELENRATHIRVLKLRLKNVTEELKKATKQKYSHYVIAGALDSYQSVRANVVVGAMSSAGGSRNSIAKIARHMFGALSPSTADLYRWRIYRYMNGGVEKRALFALLSPLFMGLSWIGTRANFGRWTSTSDRWKPTDF